MTGPSVLRYRLGHGCNSSSSHSLVLLKGDDAACRDDPPEDAGTFGWKEFALRTPEAKIVYLAAQIASQPSAIVGGYGQFVAEGLLHEYRRRCAPALQIPDMPEELYVDHQSVWALPCRLQACHEPLCLHTEFLFALMKGVLQRCAIHGGNDNDEGAHVFSDVDVPLPTDQFPYVSLRVRKDAHGWTLFDRRTGDRWDVPHDVLQPADADAVAPECYTRPALVDVKITDYCGRGCSFCYQDSTPRGTHASIESVRNVANFLAEMEVFEVAIGGGEPADHPDLAAVLDVFANYNILANVTTRVPGKILVWEHCTGRAIARATGAVAFSTEQPRDVQPFAECLRTFNMHARSTRRAAGLDDVAGVVQVVVGTTPSATTREIVEAARGAGLHTTLLGWKSTGRGRAGPSHDVRAADMLDLVLGHGRSVCVDTALIKAWHTDLVAAGADSRSYFTQEGAFSMYVDAVRDLVGPSSYAPERLMSLADFYVAWRLRSSPGMRAPFPFPPG